MAGGSRGFRRGLNLLLVRVGMGQAAPSLTVLETQQIWFPSPPPVRSDWCGRKRPSTCPGGRQEPWPRVGEEQGQGGTWARGEKVGNEPAIPPL